MICCPNKNQQPFKRKEGLKELYFRASSSYNPRETRWSNKRIPYCNKTEKKEEKEGKLPRERLKKFLCEWGPFIHKWMARLHNLGLIQWLETNLEGQVWWHTQVIITSSKYLLSWQNRVLPRMHAFQSRGNRFTDSFGKPTKIWFL
jgi:hypothetical protein